MSNDPVAIYAAVVASVVLVWDVVKWWTAKRVKLVGRTSSGMIFFYPGGHPNLDEQFIALNVDNRGQIACELQLLHLAAYKNVLDQWRGRECKSAVVNDPFAHVPASSLPRRLEPGASYRGLCQQTPELVRWSREYRLYMAVQHSMAKHSFRRF